MTATKMGSVPRDSEQPFVKAIHNVKTIVPVTTMENMVSHVMGIVLVRVRKVAISPVRVISRAKVKVVISLVRAVIRLKVATNPVRVVISLVRDRAVTNLVRDKKEVISPVKVRVTSVRVVMANLSRSLMANPTILIRKDLVNILPITIRMLSTT